LIRIAVLALFVGAFMHKEELSRAVHSFLPANMKDQQVAQQHTDQLLNKMQANAGMNARPTVVL
jgi:hypothetical protein